MESTPHGLTAPPNFWPYATYAYKSFEVPIHPAFLPLPYRTVPMQYSQMGAGSCPFRTKSQSFTIEAILNKNKNETSMYPDLTCDINSFTPASLKSGPCQVAGNHPYLPSVSDGGTLITADKKQLDPNNRGE